MTALECAMKAKCFQTLDEAIDKIQVGAFQMNNTVITNPQEVLILGQHIMPSEYTVIRIGNANRILFFNSLLNRFFNINH